MKLLNNTTIRLSEETIELLDEVIKRKIQKAIDNKTFDIMELVKSKKGISYDRAVHYICQMVLGFEDIYEKASPEDKKLMRKFHKKLCETYDCDKMNGIA